MGIKGHLRVKILFIVLLLGASATFGQGTENEDGDERQDSKAKVLDFNADIIEGELKRPQLFLELGGDVKDLESVLMTRDDFNDFHSVDMKRRLKYIE